MKKIIKSNNNLYWIFHSISAHITILKYRFGSLKTEHSSSYGKIIKHCAGGGNKLVIKNNCFFDKTVIHIIGNNNTIIFGENCNVGPECSFWIEGNNIDIIIGENTTFTWKCHFNAQENGTEIIVGKDCMFSNNIIVRTSDSHPIYDTKTMERINKAKSVHIGNHVWVAPGSEIMKGAIIGDNVIIGSQTMVNGKLPNNVLAVGRPSKVVKEDITWTRENIIFNKYNK